MAVSSLLKGTLIKIKNQKSKRLISVFMLLLFFKNIFNIFNLNNRLAQAGLHPRAYLLKQQWQTLLILTTLLAMYYWC